MFKLGIIIGLISINCFAVRNGKIQPHSSHQHLVKLEVKSSTCTGIRVSDKYILTAAHCFRKKPKTFKVEYINPSNRRKRTLKVSMKNVVIKSTQLDHELAIVKMNLPTLGSYYPIANFQRSYYQAGEEFSILGFGLNERGQLGDLRAGQLIYSSEHESDHFNYPMLMFNPNKKNHNPCPGDSGGPIFKTVGNQEYLVGIVSFISSSTTRIGKLSEVKQCRKADRSFYIPLGLHIDFLNQFL